MSEEEKLEHIGRIVDTMPDHVFLQEFVKEFGAQRAMVLAGWAVVWGITGVENTPEYRQKLRDAGLSQASVYRAARDFREFGEKLEAKYAGGVCDTKKRKGYAQDSPEAKAVIRKLKSVKISLGG